MASHVSNVTGGGALRYLYTLTGGEMIYTKDAAGALQQWQLTTMKNRGTSRVPPGVLVGEGGAAARRDDLWRHPQGGHYNDNIFAIATPVEVKA